MKESASGNNIYWQWDLQMFFCSSFAIFWSNLEAQVSDLLMDWYSHALIGFYPYGFQCSCFYPLKPFGIICMQFSLIILEIRQNWIYFSLYQYTSALHFSIISSSLFLTFGGVYHIFTSCFIKFSAADIDEKALSITV